MRARVVLLIIALTLGAGGAIHVWKMGGRTLVGWVERGQAATTKDSPRAALTTWRRPFEDDKKAVPVVAAMVHQGDVPIYLSGLGTVQAYYAVDLKAQVDGVILK